jgi:hypothetical protein
MNWRLDLNEDDAAERFPADNGDGRLDRGLSPFLTVSSYDLNQDNAGIPRTDLNDPRDPLPKVGFPPALTNFISVLRTNQMRLRHPVDLLNGKIKLEDDTGEVIEIASGVGEDELAQVLDLFTTSTKERFEGLIDVNTASITALRTVPGLDEPLAESIVSARRGIAPERRTSITWLLQEGLVNTGLFKRIAPYLTARCFQYSFHVVGYGVPTGRYRVLDVIIDLAEDEPRVVFLRDLTKLGMPFPLTGPDAVSGMRVSRPKEARRG